MVVLTRSVIEAPAALENGGQVSEGLLGLGLDPLGMDPVSGIDSRRSGAENEAAGDDGLAVRPQGGGRVFGGDWRADSCLYPCLFCDDVQRGTILSPPVSEALTPPLGATTATPCKPAATSSRSS